MSKELVISAASHERRVAILEEGQLVEIYIEREKEFALVGSIYKGKVTRVLPGMQSAFVDIGLDGDAFLYVSDVFENLEDYDHGHGEHAPAPAFTPAGSHVVEALPGETLGRASAVHEVVSPEASSEAHGEEQYHEAAHESHARTEESSDEGPMPGNEAPAPQPIAAEVHEDLDERQPESNASAPQNFSPHYNPTQNYSSQRSDRPSDRGGQGYGRSDRGGDRSDRGGRGRWGRRGGRHRGGRSHSGPAGRNLPPSKYASPQGDRDNRGNESRGNFENRGNEPRGPERHDRGRDRGSFENRGGGRGYENRGYENRRPDNPRFERSSSPASPAGSSEEPILLPGESLAKYRGKPPVPSAPVIEPDIRDERQPDPEDLRASGNLGGPLPSPGASSSGGPRRFTGGLPRWLLAEAASDSETAPVSADENIGEAEDSGLSAHGANPSRHEASPIESPVSASSDVEEDVQAEGDLSEDQAAALASEFVEAKHEETAQQVEAGSMIGGAEFDEEEVEDLQAAVDAELDEQEREQEERDDKQEDEDASDETEELGSEEQSASEAEVAAEESSEIHPLRAAERAELEANAAHESAEHEAAHGSRDDFAQESTHEHDHAEPELIEASSAHAASGPAEDAILLPGETRAPRSASAPREEFRDSARIGSGNPRSRFQRPHRGGRDRGDRGDRSDRGDRGPRGRHDRGGRPGGHRFERRGPGGPRHGHDRHSGPPRRPQLISEMLKAGQDVVVQIAKEPLGKKGARITSHVALPGRFLVYMPTIDHIGVSRKIASAENRSRLRRLVGEARGSYPGGFIVRTAAGGATDDEIRTDIEFLGKTWNEIKERSEDRKAPALLHRDLNLVERILRDYVSDDFTGIWIDNEEEYGKIVEFVSRFQPKLVNKVKLYTKETPIFEEFGIQHELDKALRAKVWLKSGGYIVINHTEALVAIDVNTGKFVGKGSTRLEDTIVKTNLEAVKEIVRQIRLRDLGGIIVVDFIDMEERRNREKVLSALQQSLEQDKAPSKALSFNEFGLVCITRKRTKQALERVLCQPCPYCTGSGMVKSIPTLCYEIQAEARKMALAAEGDNPNLTLRVHPEIAKALKTRESMLMDELEQTAHKHIIIQSDATLHWEQYDIY
jgi:Rne/Rng family ribonuclease